MNRLHQIVIGLKYKGLSYEKISKKLSGKLSTGTLKMYFAMDGKLYLPYLEYEDSQNKIREQEGRAAFKRESARAATIIINAMEKAVKAGNDDKAVKYAKEVLDRAGLVVGSNLEKDKEVEELTDEQLDDELRRLGVDPDSIKYIKKRPVAT